MSDEIRNDERDGLEKKFKKLMDEGGLRACPNLTDLPMEEKERISKGVLTHCLELLMKTYLSLGLNGEAVLGALDGFSGNKYKLHFKAMKHDEPDEHLDRGSL